MRNVTTTIVLAAAFLLGTSSTGAGQIIPSDYIYEVIRMMNMLPGPTAVPVESNLASIVRYEWLDDRWQPQDSAAFDNPSTGFRSIDSAYWDSDRWVRWSRTSYVNLFFKGFHLYDYELFDANTGEYVAERRQRVVFSMKMPEGTPLGISSREQRIRNGTSFVPTERWEYTVSGPDTAAYVSAGQRFEYDGSGWEPTHMFRLEEQDGDVVQTVQRYENQGWQNSERAYYANTTIAELYAHIGAMRERYAEYGGLNLGLLMIPDHRYQGFNGAAWVDIGRQLTEGRTATGEPTAIEYMLAEPGGWMALGEMLYGWEATAAGTRPVSSQLRALLGKPPIVIGTETYAYSANELEVRTQWRLDDTMSNGSRYRYTFADATARVERRASAGGLRIGGVQPHPVTTEATVAYRVPTAGHATLRLYDLQGRLRATLVDRAHGAGDHSVRIDASLRTGGTYILQLESKEGTTSRAITITR